MAEADYSRLGSWRPKLLVIDETVDFVGRVRSVLRGAGDGVAGGQGEPEAGSACVVEATHGRALDGPQGGASPDTTTVMVVLRPGEGCESVPPEVTDWLADDPELDVVLVLDAPPRASGELLLEVARVDRLHALQDVRLETDLPPLFAAVARRRADARDLVDRLGVLEQSLESLRAALHRCHEREEELRHDALHDSLTRLPNRALLLDRVEQCLLRAHRDPRYGFAVAFIDLDGFKNVNDTLGHAAGDRVLVEIATRLSRCIRGTDCASRVTSNTAARLGGDEFVVLLDGIEHAEDASFITGRLLEAICEPLLVAGVELLPSASAGVAVGHRGYSEAAELLRHADLALYHAKRDGKRRFAVFDGDLRERLLSLSRFELGLRLAIERGELRLQYQPIFDLQTERIVGFEALIRWEHPEYGRLWPFEFLPLAEERGIINHLGLWVLREACLQAARWQDRFPDRGRLSISVNLAQQELRAPGLIEQLEQELGRSGLPPHLLNIELSEAVLLDATTDPLILERMRSKHINVHMDAFGDGVGALDRLSCLPIRALKLDRGFVRDLARDPSALAAGRAVLVRAHARDLRVIASGIEAPEELALLRSMGCDHGQGYLLSHPLDARDVELILARHAAPRSA